MRRYSVVPGQKIPTLARQTENIRMSAGADKNSTMSVDDWSIVSPSTWIRKLGVPVLPIVALIALQTFS